jgi:CheY-like chemotaxis protein
MSLPQIKAPAGKILVVDDNPIIQRAVYFALHDRGYVVLMCDELSEAMTIVRKERPDLILLDIHFPLDPTTGGSGVSDGFGALAWMRRMDEIKDVPIVIISSDDPASASPRAQAAGAAGYLHKPFDKGQLVLTVAELLAQKRSASAG